MRGQDLVRFAAEQDFPLLTIRDLVDTEDLASQQPV